MSEISFCVTARANSTEYEYGKLIVPVTLNGHVYLCTTPGTSDSSPPTFNTASGSTTIDGSVTWTEYNPLGITYGGPLVLPLLYGDYRRKEQYIQSIEYAAGGDPYVITTQIPKRNTREISFQDMLKTTWEALDDFIDILRGTKFSFIFTDEKGLSHEARILNSNDIKSAIVGSGLVGQISIQLLLLT